MVELKPNGIRKVMLNNIGSLGKSSCAVYQIEVEIESFGEKEISILLGAEESILDSKNIAYKYSKIQNCKQELEIIKSEWKDKLEKCKYIHQ